LAARPHTAPQQDRSQATRQRLLDAAVEELVERGYARLTTVGVAERAGVSRGAQQYHFASKATLVTEAVVQLGLQLQGEMTAVTSRQPPGRPRVSRALDLTYAQFTGPLFAASLELVIAARADAELRAVVDPALRDVTVGIVRSAHDLWGDDVADHPDFERRLQLAFNTMRGLALLQKLGHPEREVERQWEYAREQLTELLTAP
jgi:AcrR family transcriptional regulator